MGATLIAIHQHEHQTRTENSANTVEYLKDDPLWRLSSDIKLGVLGG